MLVTSTKPKIGKKKWGIGGMVASTQNTSLSRNTHLVANGYYTTDAFAFKDVADINSKSVIYNLSYCGRCECGGPNSVILEIVP